MDSATKNACIDTAKTFERRRCNHHTLPEPLSALECIKSVVDPKDGGTNKHRYVVASQDRKIRSEMRNIAGVPLIYINRSVMIMEPMASKTEEVREAEERTKVRAGLKPRRGADLDSELPLKRKRSEDDDDDEQNKTGPGGAEASTSQAEGDSVPRKKRKGGPKGPNPLSVKKTKKKSTEAEVDQSKQIVAKATKQDPQAGEKALDAATATSSSVDATIEEPTKKKRRRKHKSTPQDADEKAPDTEALVAEV